MIEKELPDFESQAALFLKITPSRSRQPYSKQVCLWDLVQIICITFIIQVAWAI